MNGRCISNLERKEENWHEIYGFLKEENSKQQPPIGKHSLWMLTDASVDMTVTCTVGDIVLVMTKDMMAGFCLVQITLVASLNCIYDGVSQASKEDQVLLRYWRSQTEEWYEQLCDKHAVTLLC